MKILHDYHCSRFSDFTIEISKIGTRLRPVVNRQFQSAIVKRANHLLLFSVEVLNRRNLTLRHQTREQSRDEIPNFPWCHQPWMRLWLWKPSRSHITDGHVRSDLLETSWLRRMTVITKMTTAISGYLVHLSECHISWLVNLVLNNGIVSLGLSKNAGDKPCWKRLNWLECNVKC